MSNPIREPGCGTARFSSLRRAVDFTPVNNTAGPYPVAGPDSQLRRRGRGNAAMA